MFKVATHADDSVIKPSPCFVLFRIKTYTGQVFSIQKIIPDMFLLQIPSTKHVLIYRTLEALD